MSDGSVTATLKKIGILKSHFDLISQPANKQAMDVETTTGMDFGLSEIAESQTFAAKIRYSVILRGSDGNVYGKFEGEFLGEFQVLAKHGFDSWADLPPQALVPYFSFIHFIAREKALQAFANGGFKGFQLPVPDELAGKGVLIKDT